MTSHFCTTCNGPQHSNVIWVKFYKESKRIDTKFICTNCNQPKLHIENVTEEEKAATEETAQIEIAFQN